MEQFSLDKYLENPSRKVVTRDGRNARIICTDRKDLDFPIIALIENISGKGEKAYSYTKEGWNSNYCSNNLELFFAPKKHEGWINIFDNTYPGNMIFDTKEVAEEQGMSFEGYVTTIKIEWGE